MEVEWFNDFAKELLDERGVKVDDDTVRAQLVKDVSTRARDYVLRRLLDSLSEKELAELEAAIDSGDEKAGQKIVDGKKNEVAKAMGGFRSVYLGRA